VKTGFLEKKQCRKRHRHFYDTSPVQLDKAGNLTVGVESAKAPGTTAVSPA
jgi:hypothetical protein